MLSAWQVDQKISVDRYLGRGTAMKQTTPQARNAHKLDQKQKDDLINELLNLADKLKGVK